MSDLDAILQESLERLENGEPLADTLAALPAEADELRPLIETVAGLQGVSHAVLLDPQRQKIRAQVVSAAWAAAHPDVRSKPRRGSWSWLPKPAAAGLLAVFLFTAVILFGMGIWLAGPTSAHAAVLSDLSGLVEVATSNAPQDWKTATEGMKVYSGDSMRTGPDGSAALIFFEGSQTVVDPGTNLILNRLDGRWGDVLQVELTQSIGKTQQSLLLKPGSRTAFVVHTPAGDAQAHGTQFSVSVLPDGQSRVVVETGEVAVTNAEGQVKLAAGQVTRWQADQAPQLLGYEFSLLEQLTAAQVNNLVVADISIAMDDLTILLGGPLLSGEVRIDGHIRPDGTWIAESVEVKPARGNGISQFSGVIDANEGDLWQIGGETVLVNDLTGLKGNLVVGQVVKVDFVILDGGRWQALEIKALDEEEVQSASDQNLNEDRSACTGTETHPTGDKLADRYGVTYEEIMDWFCQGFGFGEIDLAYSLSLRTGTPVEEIFAMRLGGMGWGNIHRDLTSTATLTSTLPVEIVQGGEEQNQGIHCLGDEIHPTGKNLADHYGVPYAEIMGWFCQGYGFGEIDLVYSMAQESGAKADQIFALKKSGLGWGEIKQQMKEFKEKNTPPGQQDKNPPENRPEKDESENKEPANPNPQNKP